MFVLLQTIDDWEIVIVFFIALFVVPLLIWLSVFVFSAVLWLVFPRKLMSLRVFAGWFFFVSGIFAMLLWIFLGILDIVKVEGVIITIFAQRLLPWEAGSLPIRRRVNNCPHSHPTNPTTRAGSEGPFHPVDRFLYNLINRIPQT
jgi:hypothetical protein